MVGGLTQTEMTYIGRDTKEHKAKMGHVAVVVPGGPSKPGSVKLADGTLMPVRGGYPYCHQGAAHEIYRFKERTQVDAVFPALLLGRVAWLETDAYRSAILGVAGSANERFVDALLRLPAQIVMYTSDNNDEFIAGVGRSSDQS